MQYKWRILTYKYEQVCPSLYSIFLCSVKINQSIVTELHITALINCNFQEQWTQHQIMCFGYTVSNSFTTEARLNFSFRLKSYLSRWRKFPSLSNPFCFPPAFPSHSWYTSPYKPLSVLITPKKILYLLPLWSKMQSNRWLRRSITHSVRSLI